MATCPTCQNKVTETAKFCSECGTRLKGTAAEPGWIVARQLEIKHIKENDLSYTIFAAVGALAAIAIPFIVRFVLRYRMDAISWLLTAAGLLFFFGGFAGTWYNDKKVKDVIKELEEGPKKNSV